MRELNSDEHLQVNGGNLVVGAYWAVQALGGAGAGVFGGGLVNSFNAKVSRMSLGEAIYRTVNSN